MSSYRTKEFKQLKDEWYKKLKDTGFDDQENSRERLYEKNNRTVSWVNQDRIRDFFLAVDTFLVTAQIPLKHREILTLWSDGRYLTEISKELRIPYITVCRAIYKYKSDILKNMSNFAD